MAVTIPGNTLNELLQYWATRPDWNLPAFVSVDPKHNLCSINRKQVLEYASRFAHKLSQHGVTKGSIVCSTLPNSIERVVCDMGIYLAGAISMNGQIFRSDGQDFINSLRLSKAQFVVLDPSDGKLPFQILKKEGLELYEHCVKCDSLPDLCHVIFCRRDVDNTDNDFLSSLKDPLLNHLSVTVSPSDAATILTTSGSTGYSKLVKLTHANLCHFCVQVKAIEPLHVGDRFINCAPLGWAGGFPQWYLGCGVTRYFLDMYNGPPESVPLTVWQTIVKERIVYGFLSPMYVTEILNNSSLWSNSDWKPNTLCLAGQPIKRGHLDIIGKLCSAVDINYGMTECNLVTTHRITDPDNGFTDGCAGYPGYGVSLKVVDKDRNVLPQGSTGEILLKSPALTVGYLNNDEANAKAFTSDGWLCTDDAGYVDAEGKVFVEGRQSDSILRGAYILYPGWLEQQIKKLDRVKDVVIVAVPDPVLHHEICACVIPHSYPKQNDVQNLNCHRSDNSTLRPHSFIEQEYGRKYDSSNLISTDKSVKMGQTENDSPLTMSNEQLEQIRFRGMKKPLTVDYNQTKVKKEDAADLPGVSLSNEFIITDSKSQTPFEMLEMEIRNFCNQSQTLGEKDAMRMIPKYYLFMEKYPVSGTGKLSRERLRQLAATALNLSE